MSTRRRKKIETDAPRGKGAGRRASRLTPMKVARALIARLEEGGVPPWVAPWDQNGGLPRNLVSKKSYSGCNSLILWWASLEHGFASSYWMTLNQAHARGGRVRPGQRCTAITTWWFPTHRRLGASGQWTEERAPAEGYVELYNLEQVEGVKPPKSAREERGVVERDAEIERWLQATHAPIVHGGASAYYTQLGDTIHMPELAHFGSSGGYYATLMHELVHYTGHERRIDRDLEGRFGDPSYAKEELVAELGAAFLCAEFGVPGELRHDAYLASWLQALQAEPQLLLKSASTAQTAVRYLHAVAEGRPTARFRSKRKARKRGAKTAQATATVLAMAS